MCVCALCVCSVLFVGTAQSGYLTVPEAIFSTIPHLFLTVALGINIILPFRSSNTLFSDTHTHSHIMDKSKFDL